MRGDFNPRGVGPGGVLRPLRWFGLLECREDPASRYKALWRKSALFDRFLTFDTKLPRMEGTMH